MIPRKYNLFNFGIIVLLSALPGFSQSMLRGKITDFKSGEPIAFASVFFSNTTIGTATREDGSFEIKNIPNGKYDLTISMVGYKRMQVAMEFPRADTPVKINIEQDPIDLSPVTIVADQADTKKYFHDFVKHFIGESGNSRRCRIVNPQDIHLYYDAETKTLTGHASNPIVVENVALGYRLHYILDVFELDYRKGLREFTGIPRFEELEPQSERTKRNWHRSRLEAYHGSLNHFIRSLYNNNLEREGFKVSITDNTYIADKPIILNDFLKGTARKVFSFKGMLRLEYIKEYAASEYGRGRFGGYQKSILEFRHDQITIFENGNYVDPLGILLFGYLGWTETVGEMLPLSYYPPKED